MVNSRADTLYTVHHPFDPIPLSRSAVDSAIAAESNQIEEWAKDRGLGGATIRRVIDDFERAAQGREYPEIHPPLNRSSLIGRDGSLWIEIRTASANHRTYMVLGPEGGLVGSANVPVSVEIGDADLVTVWAVEQGEFDVPSIVRYRVSWH